MGAHTLTIPIPHLTSPLKGEEFDYFKRSNTYPFATGMRLSINSSVQGTPLARP